MSSSTPATNPTFTRGLDIDSLKPAWERSRPFNHLVFDDFLSEEIAAAVVEEFPAFDEDAWRIYNNAIEVKKLQNHWDKFGATTYRLFQWLNSRAFIAELEKLTDCPLHADFGLNGGGLHTHRSGGKLNTHLDYSIHPKLRLERRLNLLIYITPGWQEEWGGALGLWAKDKHANAPGELCETIAPLFNRAVVFDTSQDSWHGLPEPILCPADVTRNSLAVYYLCEPRVDAVDRGKAHFAPYKEQAKDPEVLALIEKRSQVASAAEVYGDK
jgi:Rps23 Pro-64 3,4-dihydroxylase Tpa1-like proline 4-hydroxylase